MNYIELVENGIYMNQSELREVEAFYLTEVSNAQLNKALLAVRIEYPLLEGVKSAFIRAAVIYKLMLKSHFLPGRK